jgi:hypothetical protein
MVATSWIFDRAGAALTHRIQLRRGGAIAPPSDDYQL